MKDKRYERWYYKHKELQDEGWQKLKERHRRFKEKYRERIKEENRKRYLRDREKIRQQYKESYRTDPEYRRKCLERKRVYAKERRLKLRFQIFQRDNFVCQYCGRKPPKVVLEVDHLFPKNKGGKDDKNNYITSCRECNIGKGDVILKEFKD